MFVGKPEGKRAIGRCRHRWEGNIKVDDQAVDDGLRATVNAVMNLCVSLNAENLLTWAVTLSRKTPLHGVSRL